MLIPPFCSRKICHLIVCKTASSFAETLYEMPEPIWGIREMTQNNSKIAYTEYTIAVDDPQNMGLHLGEFI